MKNFGSSRNRTLLFLAMAAASIGTANAGVEVGHVNRASGSNAVSFAVANSGAAQVGDLQVYLNGHGSAVSCANLTAHGSAFALGGALDAGDSVACSGAVSGQSASITASGNGADGVPFSYTAHQIYQPAAVPAQALVGILLGAVFNNTDADSPAAFDAGETISLSFTVFNFGNVALSGIAVSDSLGTTISCPGTSLAVGASMDCTGTYVIAGANVGAGAISDDATVTANGPGSLTANSDDSVIRTPTTAAEIRGLKSPRLTQDNDGNNVAGLGDLVGYTFAVKNSGSLALSPVNMTEPDPSRINGGTITCNATTLGGSAFSGLGTGTLNVGDTVLCAASYTIQALDVTAGEADNLANITGQPQFGGVASGSAASAFVVPAAPPPAPPTPSPVNDWRAMLLLGLGLLAVGFGVTRRRKQHNS